MKRLLKCTYNLNRADKLDAEYCVCDDYSEQTVKSPTLNCGSYHL